MALTTCAGARASQAGAGTSGREFLVVDEVRAEEEPLLLVDGWPIGPTGRDSVIASLKGAVLDSMRIYGAGTAETHARFGSRGTHGAVSVWVQRSRPLYLRDVRVIRDTTRFPAPFYEGVAVLRFRRSADQPTQQRVMDLLQAELIASRPVPGDRPELIVRLRPGWTDSLTQHYARSLRHDAVTQFGYLLADPITTLTGRPIARDTALIDQHYESKCNVRSDRAVRRRVVYFLFADATAAEREVVRALMHGEWLPGPGEGISSFPPMVVVGTRAQVQRKADQIEHLPFVQSVYLNDVRLAMTSPGGLSSVCP